MKGKIIFLAAVASALLSGCCNKERTIEFPAVDAPNTTSAIIEKVELTDSVTNVYIRGYHRPKWWIRIVPETYLMADGKKYEIIGSEGIELGSKLHMPADGDSLFTLKFAPLPLRTKSFDLVEGDEEGSWRFVGINLTDKPSDAYDKGLPKHVKITSETVTETSEFKYEIGECTINVHLLGYSPSYGKCPEIHTGNLIGVPVTHKIEINPETGCGSITFKQYGTLNGFVMTDYRRMGEFWMAPGEAIDLYIDLSYMDYQAACTRKTYKTEVPVKPLYTDGSIYDCINNLPLDNELDEIRLTAGIIKPGIYSLTADEITESIINEYNEAVKTVEAMDSHPLAKNIKLAELKVSCIDGINRADDSRWHSYRMANPDLNPDEIDYTPDRITEEHRERVLKMIDFKNPLLMLNKRNTTFALMKLDIDDAARFGKLRYIQPTRANFDIAENGVLTDEQLQEMRKWDEPFFYNMMQDIQNTILERLANESDRIQKTPDVPLEELFKTIVAPHKGKVVMVDFWNTWCGPCRQALGLTEPLKSGKLADENLVWIYIANETSAISKYLEMIPDIKGLHYRLNDEQWKQLTNKDFDIDGIPSYVLVKKDGSYSLRNDLRNHDKFINTLKAELK